MRRLICILLFVLVALPVSAQDATFLPQPPDNVEVITPDNANRLELLATLGRGEIRDMAWSPDESLFIVKTSIGIWVYEDLNQPPFLIEGASQLATFDAAQHTLAIHNLGRIDIWNLHRREKHSVTVEEGKSVIANQPIFLSADGQLLYFLVQEDKTPHLYEVVQWDIPQHQIKASVAIGNNWIDKMRMNPRRDTLLIDRSSGVQSVLLSDKFAQTSLDSLTAKGAVFHPSEPIIAYFAVNDIETQITLFNYQTHREMAAYSIPRRDAQMRLFFSPEGDYLFARVSHSYKGELYQWNLETGAVKRGLSENDIAPDVYDLFLTQFSPDGRYLSTESDYRSEIWGLENLQILEPPWKGHYVRFNQEGTQVVVGNVGEVLLFSAEAGTLIHEFTGGDAAPVFSPTGKQIAIVDQSERSVSIYPAAVAGDGIQLNGYGHYNTLGFSPQGKYLVTQNGRDLAFWQAPFKEYIPDIAPRIPIISFSGTDQAMYMSAFDNSQETLLQWWINETDNGIEGHEGESFYLNTGDHQLNRYVLDLENGIFVGAGGEDSGYFDGTPFLFLRDLKSDRYQYVYGHTGQINSLAFSPNRKLLATGSGYITEYYTSEDTTLRLWDVSRVDSRLQLTGRALFRYVEPVDNLVFNQTGRLIGLTAWYEFSVRDTLTGREIFQHDAYRPEGLAFSPDSRLLITKSNNGLDVWKLETGEALLNLPTPARYEWGTTIHFDPNGRWIVTSNNLGVVRLYGVVDKD